MGSGNCVGELSLRAAAASDKGACSMVQGTHYHAECTATAFCTKPTKVKPGELPEGVKTQTARHYRVADEMAWKEP